MNKWIIYTLLLIGLPFLSIAQNSYSTTNKKAIKSYEEALTAYNRMDYIVAVEKMQKSIKYDKNFIEAHIVLAEIFVEKGDKKQAIKSYRNVIDINPGFFPALYFSLAQLEMMESDFENAKSHLEKYLTYKNQRPTSITKAKQTLKSCEFAIHAVNNPVPFNPENIGNNINSKYDEYWPSLTADEQTLIITRLMPKDTSLIENNSESQNYVPRQSTMQEDFYISNKENGFWTEAISAGESLNTLGNEGAQSILVSGKIMYFTACERSDGQGRCDIYKSNKTKNGWSEAINIGSPVNSKYWEAQPSISSDGKTLYFVSNREGGLGKNDIWLSNLKSDGTWTKPYNLGDKINTSAIEQSPFIHPDNKTLYFSSNGRTGMGGFDLYKVTKDSNGNWGEPKNLGYPINTVFDDFGLIVNAKGNRAFFASDRYSKQGRDIFEFELYKEARPQSVSYLKGKVFDVDTKKNLCAKFDLIDIETNKLVMQAESDPITGEFLVCIPTDHDYALNVSKAKYLFYSDNFSLKGLHEIKNPFLKDIALQGIKVGQKIILKNIFYETDSYQLADISIAELSKLQEFLKENSSLKIEISGHTDNVGTSTYNMELSTNRAKSVVDFLIKSGINPTRLVYKGYGELQAINSNETEKGRAENRRTEVKILGN